MCALNAQIENCHCNLISKDGKCVDSVSKWAIIGVSIGGAALILLVAVIILVVIMKKKGKKLGNVVRADFSSRAAVF